MASVNTKTIHQLTHTPRGELSNSDVILGHFQTKKNTYLLILTPQTRNQFLDDQNVITAIKDEQPIRPPPQEEHNQIIYQHELQKTSPTFSKRGSLTAFTALPQKVLRYHAVSADYIGRFYLFVGINALCFSHHAFHQKRLVKSCSVISAGFIKHHLESLILGYLLVFPLSPDIVAGMQGCTKNL